MTDMSGRMNNLQIILRCVVVAALAANALSVLATYPGCLSYFNEMAGGTERGHEHLLHSSLCWGQDGLALEQWISDHPEATPLYLEPSIFWRDLRLTLELDRHADDVASEHRYIATDATELQRRGLLSPVRGEASVDDRLAQALRTGELVDRVGASVYIYRVDSEIDF